MWFKRELERLSNGLITLVLIAAVAALLMASATIHGCRDRGAPALRPKITRYFSQLIELVTKADEEGLDLLASPDAFFSFHKKICPGVPIWLQTVAPAAFDPASKTTISAQIDRPDEITRESFYANLRTLEDIREHIRKTGGKSQGKLQRSGDLAEPADVPLGPRKSLQAK